MPKNTRLELTNVIIPAAIALILTCIIGCSASHLTNVWKDPEYKNRPMLNLFIIAAKNNPVNRRLWEDEIVMAMSAEGISATPSYRLFADSIPDPAQVGSAVRENRFDGVLFIRRLPPEVSTSYVPGAVRNEQVTRYNKRTQTYTTFYREVQDPGYTDTSHVERHEISVLSTAEDGGHLIWSGTGELINPTSRDQVRQEISGLIAPELKSNGIIHAK